MSGGGGGASWADAVKISVSYDVNEQQKLMLNGVVTPIVNHVMTHLNESYTYNTISPFQVFPPTWTEAIFDDLIARGYAETGWGDSLEREAWRVLSDVRNEYVSVEAARDQYGVVVDTTSWSVDEQKTAELRKTMSKRQGKLPLIDRGKLPPGVRTTT